MLNRSTNVCRYSLDDVAKLFQVRLVLEIAAVEAVAARWTDQAAARLTARVEQMIIASRIPDIGKWRLADYSFHREVYILTGNPFLIQASVAIAAAPFANLLCPELPPLTAGYPVMANEHYELVDAIRKGPQVAGEFARHHMETWHSRMLRPAAGAAGRT